MAHSHPPTGTAIISARGLTQSFRTADREQTVLNGLDVDIRRGDFTAIMGPSGAGKSTSSTRRHPAAALTSEEQPPWHTATRRPAPQSSAPAD